MSKEFKIISSSTGLKDKLLKSARDKLSVFVGVQSNEPKKSKDGKVTELGNAQIAAINEFGATIRTGNGTITIPERPFVRGSINANRNKYLKLNAQAAKKILAGNLKVEDYLEFLGTKASNDMKKYATDLREPPNAEMTIKLKKSDNPLVDTRQMINSISYVVAKRDDFENKS